MTLLRLAATVGALVAFAAIASAPPASSGQAPAPEQPAAASPQWGGWHGMMGHWPMGRGWQGPGPMPRHHLAMMWGVPAPYAGMTNPLPRTQATLDAGAAVYTENCVSCHGKEGLGDGEAGRDLSPPPGNLAWLSEMPMSRWDGFVYWTVAEGGAPLGTAMPAFKDSLSPDQIWAVTAYIQAHLPAHAGQP
ncbi:MAG: c-type cytochrome [Alphaproteobacteria bacterium]|nr:c-type cytochrome [Alphaproteobacteria bacterium]